MWFASYLCEEGVITGDQFADAARIRLARTPMLGGLAMRMGLLTMKQCREILTAQADTPEKQFGSLAIEKGFLTREQLNALVVAQMESAPRLGEILVETGAISRSQMLDALHRARLGTDRRQRRDQPVAAAN